METKIYLAVRVAAVTYLFYRLWIFLFCRKIYGLWDKLYHLARMARIRWWRYKKRRNAENEKRAGRKVMWDKGTSVKTRRQAGSWIPGKDSRPETGSESGSRSLPAQGNSEVIGKSKFVYLEDPDISRNIPDRSEPLPPSDFMGEEEDISPDEVEDNLMPDKPGRKMLSEAEMEDLMAPVSAEPDPDFSTALTFEQLGNVAEVLLSAPGDEPKDIWAAETLYRLKDTDLYNFFACEVGTQEDVERLLGECLDERGQPLPARKRTQKENGAGTIDWSEYM